MKFKTFSKVLVMSSVCFFGATVQAQNVQKVFTESIEMMKTSDWSGALASIDGFLSRMDDAKAMKLHGPMFGVFHYNRAICLDNLGDFKGAMAAYDTCHLKFPNGGGKSENFYFVYSLFKKGETAMKAEDYEVAVQSYGAFLGSYKGDKASAKTNWGSFFVNYGVALLKTGDKEKGMEMIEKALKNKEKFAIAPATIYKAFDALSAVAIENNDERSVLKFLKDYKSALLSDPAAVSQYARGMIGKVSQAIQADMEVLPVELLSLVPNTQTSLNNLKAQAGTLEGATFSKAIRDGYIFLTPDYIQKLLASTQAQAGSDEPNEAYTLNLSAYLWSRAGNNNAAYSAYKELEESYPKAKNREENLFALVQMANAVGYVKEANAYGNTFLTAFPDSDKIEKVKRLMLTGLYRDRKYAECIEVAEELMPNLEKGSEAHEVALFVLGGSKFYTGDISAAQKLLTQHGEEYPKSAFIIESSYMEASSCSRLGQFDKAIGKLENFLEKYKSDNTAFYPYALFDRANAAYSTNDNKTALTKIDDLEKGYRSTPIMAAAFNLKGNVLESEKDYSRAEEYYNRGLTKAGESSDKRVASESVFYLINLLSDYPGEGDRYKDAAKYYDQFWADYAKDSPYQAQVAVQGYNALKEIGRADEGLNKMEDIVNTVAKLPGQPQLEALVNTYRDNYLEANGIVELKKKFNDFKGVSEDDREALALIKISLIGAYEKELDKAKKKRDEEGETKLQAGIKVVFNELKNEFKPTSLTPAALSKVGTYIRTKTNTPRGGLPYYEEIIKRQDAAHTNQARFGIADILAGSAKGAEQAKASTLLAEIFKNEGVRGKDRARALYRLIQLNESQNDWGGVKANALLFFKEKYTYELSYVSFYYAQALDNLGEKELALTNYQKTYFGNQGFVPVAAPSLKRMMEIYWERNRPQVLGEDKLVKTIGDRQFAYNSGWVYIDATKRSIDKMSDSEKRLRESVAGLVAQYAASKQIVDMATQKNNNQ